MRPTMTSVQMHALVEELYAKPGMSRAEVTKVLRRHVEIDDSMPGLDPAATYTLRLDQPLSDHEAALPAKAVRVRRNGVDVDFDSPDTSHQYRLPRPRFHQLYAAPAKHPLPRALHEVAGHLMHLATRESPAREDVRAAYRERAATIRTAADELDRITTVAEEKHIELVNAVAQIAQHREAELGLHRIIQNLKDEVPAAERERIRSILLREEPAEDTITYALAEWLEKGDHAHDERPELPPEPECTCAMSEASMNACKRCGPRADTIPTTQRSIVVDKLLERFKPDPPKAWLVEGQIEVILRGAEPKQHDMAKLHALLSELVETFFEREIQSGSAMTQAQSRFQALRPESR